MPTTPEFPLIWDLDSILPHPSTDAFRDALKTFRQDLEALAERSDSLPIVNGDAANVAGWTDFLRELESVSGRASELNSFIGCQAAADANDKLFQQLEGRLSALDPLREQIATNVEFALKTAAENDLSDFVAADQWLQEIAFFIE